MSQPKLPHVVSFVVGFVVCLGVTLATGRREAWDAPEYFIIGIPTMCAVIVWVSYRWPERAWRWVLSMAVGQGLAMATSGNSLTLWPLTIIAMTVCSVPQFIAAVVTGKLARRR